MKIKNIEIESLLKVKSIKSTYVLAIIFLCLFSQKAIAQCSPPFHPDYEALIAFYNATDGANWTNNGGWADAILGTNCNPCTGNWQGVFCNANNRVNRIHLIENNLNGEIPTEFFDIAELDTLNLRDNFISGEINPLFSNLINLETLHLINNQLTGEIPAELGQLVNLEYLRLNTNMLTGELPPELGMLINLIFLDVYGNQLTGEIPPELGQLINLETLFLYDNMFYGGIPIEITELENLTNLDLYGNEFSGEIPAELGQLTNLKYLYLNSNGFTGEIPSEIYQISTLEHLYFDSNFLTGQIDPQVGQLTGLTRLSYADNFLTGNIPTEIGQLVNLQFAYFNHNQFDGELPTTIGQLTNLDSLLISSNQLTGSIPTEIGQLTNLVALAIDSNLLDGPIPSEIGLLTNISLLDVSFNQLTGEVPTEIDQLTNLQDLILNDNQLSGCFSPQLFDICSGVNVLLGNNKLMPWQGDYSQFCSSAGDLTAQLNAPCDDENAITENDAIDDTCTCRGDCTIYNISYNQNCEIDDALSLELDFEYAATSSTFIIELEGSNLGTYNYADLPILISPLDSSPNDTLVFSIIDSEAGCNQTFVVKELSCVWPGDANFDLTSDNYDLLNLGLTFNFTGPVRDDQTTTWDGKAAQSWAGAFVDSINHKHADTDGNGIINYADTTALLQNYSQIHNKTDVVFNEFSIDDPVLYVKLPDTTLVGGTYIEAPIVLGSDMIPVSGFYGLAFTLEFDAGFAVENSVSITVDDSFLGTQSDLIHIQKQISPDIFDLGISRINQSDVDGFGDIATVGFVLMENLEGKREVDFQIKITAVKAISASEKLIALNTAAETADVISTIENEEFESNISIYPNPATNFINVNTNEPCEISIYNTAGKLMLSENNNSNSIINVSDLESGIYLLIIQNDKSITERKILVNPY